MPLAPDTFSERAAAFVWRIWPRIYILVFLVFAGLNLLAANQYGWSALVRFWGAGFALIGLAAVAWTWRGIRKAQASAGWPRVEARIVSSRVAVEREGSTSSIEYGGRMTYYYPEIQYEYDVEGLTYRSSRILFVNVNYSHEDARAAVARYPAGGKAAAFVDPANPRLAVLEPGLEGGKGKYARAGLVGAVFTLAGAAILVIT